MKLLTKEQFVVAVTKQAQAWADAHEEEVKASNEEALADAESDGDREDIANEQEEPFPACEEDLWIMFTESDIDLGSFVPEAEDE